MKFHEWLNEHPGRATWLAKHFSVTPAAVSQWRANGAPVGYLRKICDLSAGAITLDDLLEEIEQRKSQQK